MWLVYVTRSTLPIFPPEIHANPERVASMVAQSGWTSTVAIALLVAVAATHLVRARRHILGRTTMRLLVGCLHLIAVAVVVLIGYTINEMVLAPAVTVELLYRASGVPAPGPILLVLCGAALLGTSVGSVTHRIGG